MQTTYDQYSQYEYLINEKESKEQALIQFAKDFILFNIESLELENIEDMNQEELTRFKEIDLNVIEINDIETICFDDYSIREELENLYTLESEITELENKIIQVNSILAKLPKSSNIECSRKSESTYVTYPIETLNEFINNHANLIEFNYYEDLTNEELNELDTFKVRVACHEVGSKYNEYSNESVSYSDECIFIKS